MMNADDVRRLIENLSCPICHNPMSITELLFVNDHSSGPLLEGIYGACEPCWAVLEETKAILDNLEDSL